VGNLFLSMWWFWMGDDEQNEYPNACGPFRCYRYQRKARSGVHWLWTASRAQNSHPRATSQGEPAVIRNSKRIVELKPREQYRNKILYSWWWRSLWLTRSTRRKSRTARWVKTFWFSPLTLAA
jgi:hypothetical protein